MFASVFYMSEVLLRRCRRCFIIIIIFAEFFSLAAPLILSFSFSNSRCMIELWACVRMVDVHSAGLVFFFYFLFFLHFSLLLFHSLVHVNGGVVPLVAVPQYCRAGDTQIYASNINNSNNNTARRRGEMWSRRRREKKASTKAPNGSSRKWYITNIQSSRCDCSYIRALHAVTFYRFMLREYFHRHAPTPY